MTWLHSQHTAVYTVLTTPDNILSTHKIQHNSSSILDFNWFEQKYDDGVNRITWNFWFYKNIKECLKYSSQMSTTKAI